MTLFESGLLENRDFGQEKKMIFFDIDFKANKKFSVPQKPKSLHDGVKWLVGDWWVVALAFWRLSGLKPGLSDGARPGLQEEVP